MNGTAGGQPSAEPVRLADAAEQAPSDRRPAEPPAYELKFLLDEARARQAETWARQHLRPDPHADVARDGIYHTLSLYLDTPRLDVYHRSKGVGRAKFRIRRYGSESCAYLERKARKGDRVRKRRTNVPLEELFLLTDEAPAAWPGAWFEKRLRIRGLRPTCLVRYERTALISDNGEGPLRLTIDRAIRGLPTESWSLDGPPGLPLLEGHAALELKFRDTLPALFKRLIEELGLQPGAVSKYRLCVEAWGLAAPVEGSANA